MKVHHLYIATVKIQLVATLTILQCCCGSTPCWATRELGDSHDTAGV